MFDAPGAEVGEKSWESSLARPRSSRSRAEQRRARRLNAYADLCSLAERRCAHVRPSSLIFCYPRSHLFSIPSPSPRWPSVPQPAREIGDRPAYPSKPDPLEPQPQQRVCALLSSARPALLSLALPLVTPPAAGTCWPPAPPPVRLARSTHTRSTQASRVGLPLYTPRAAEQ